MSHQGVPETRPSVLLGKAYIQLAACIGFAARHDQSSARIIRGCNNPRGERQREAAQRQSESKLNIRSYIANLLHHTHSFEDFPEFMAPRVVATGLGAYVLRHTDTGKCRGRNLNVSALTQL